MLRLSLVLFAMIAALATAADPDPKAEAKAMTGTWTLTTAEVGGQALPEAVTKTLTLVLADGKYTLKSPGGDDTGTVKLDPSKSPKELDVIGEAGPNKGKTLPAIYELNGDTLRICYDLDGKKRPTEFKSAAGTKQFLAVYKRKKGE